ncbi:hypothetical protein FKM82_028491 [Ascaphus truei]
MVGPFLPFGASVVTTQLQSLVILVRSAGWLSGVSASVTINKGNFLVLSTGDVNWATLLTGSPCSARSWEISPTEAFAGKPRITNFWGFRRVSGKV